MAGRAHEFARLTEWWERARTGRAHRVLVSGEGGIGKTTVVDAFAARCADARVVRVVAEPDGPPGAVLGQFRAALGLRPAVTGSPQDDVTGLLDAVGVLEEAGPVILVVHDLHLVDEASDRVLVQVLRHLHDDPVLVLATARPEGLAARWIRLFEEGADADRLPLDGLDEAGVGELVRTQRPGRWSRAAIARLHRGTAGHPLHLTTLLRELPDDALSGDGPLPAPRPLADEVAAVLARLSPPARGLVDALAVLDRPADDRTLDRLADLVGRAGSPGRHEAIAAGLVEEVTTATVSGAVLRLRHPLLRSAIDTALDPVERARLHRGAAEMLGGRAGLAHRVAAAAGAPDPSLAAELEASARAESDDRDAATQLLAAVELSGSGADAERRRLAAALRLMDAYDTDRLQALGPAVRAAAPGPERELVLGFLASLENHPDAARHLHTAVTLEGADPDVRARAAVRLALEHVVRAQGAEADTVAAQVPTLTSSPLRVEQALFLQAIGRAHQEGPEAGLGLLAGRLDGALTADPAMTAGMLLLAVGDPLPARRRLEEALTRFERGAGSTSIQRAHMHLAEALFHTGHWDLAEAQAEIALGWFADGDRSWGEAAAHAIAGLVPAARARVAETTARLDEARAILARTFSPQGRTAIAITEAVAARALGDPEGVLRVTTELAKAAERVGFLAGAWAPWRAMHVEALIDRGDLPAAGRLLRATRVDDRPLGADLTGRRLDGRLAEATGRPEAAEAAYRAGLAVAAAHGRDVDAACRVELAELRAALGTLGRGADAAEHRAAARATFVALGADARAERLTEPSTTRTVPDPPARPLTARERQIANLVAQGMTRREVAESLWITTKAVDFHLGNVYTKLGVSSRRELRGRTFT